MLQLIIITDATLLNINLSLLPLCQVTMHVSRFIERCHMMLTKTMNVTSDHLSAQAASFKNTVGLVFTAIL